MNLECWQRILKEAGYVAPEAEPVQTDADLATQLNGTAVPMFELDLESIDSGDDYRRLLGRISRLLGDDLPLRRIKATLDEDSGTASVQFEWRDRPYQWTFEQMADWVSEEFLDKLDAFVAEHTSGRLLALPPSDPYLYLIYVPAKLGERLATC